jgi:hypothetical protein
LKWNKINRAKTVKLAAITVVLFQTLLNFPIANAGSKVELAYDNGNAGGLFTLTTGGLGEVGLGVHFSTRDTIMLGSNETTISKIRMYTSSNTFCWRIQNWNATAKQPGSTIIANGTTTATHEGWLDIDVGPLNVSRDFFVGIYNSTPSGNVTLSWDDSTNASRSIVISPGVSVKVDKNFLLRVIVDIPVNLQDIMVKIEELETEVEINQYLIDEMNNTLNMQLSTLTQYYGDLNGTFQELNNTFISRLDYLTQSCENVSQTVIEINAKIGEPSSTVFSDLEEILSKLDMILKRLGLPVGGSVLPIGEVKLILETMSDNLNAMVLLALFGVAVTWIARKQSG